MPYVLTGVQVAVGRSLVVIVVAEMFVGSLGGIGVARVGAWLTPWHPRPGP